VTATSIAPKPPVHAISAPAATGAAMRADVGEHRLHTADPSKTRGAPT